MNTVNTGAELALDLLAAQVNTARSKVWRQVQFLVPELGTELREHVKALTALTSPLKEKVPKTKKPPKVKGLCSCCHQELPHRTYLSRQIHGHYSIVARARKRRWSKYPKEQDRRDQTALARSTVLAARHDRWVAALKAFDPLRTEHLLNTQGPSAVVALWRTLPISQRRRLLRTVPPPPKRLYKGEVLVRKGLRPYRPRKGKDWTQLVRKVTP